MQGKELLRAQVLGYYVFYISVNNQYLLKGKLLCARI